MEKFRHELTTGAPGLTISFILHAVAAIVLAMILHHVQRDQDDAPLSFEWSPTRSTDRRIQPVTLPVNVLTTPVTTTAAASPATPPTPTSPPNESKSPTSQGTGIVAPVEMRGALEGRSSNVQGSGKSGSTPQAERGIRAGLLWLSRQQQKDGRWELHRGYPDAGFAPIKTDTGATALALLAMLGNGHTHRSGEFSSHIAKGLRWLTQIQDSATGDFHDLRSEEGREGAMYAHALATMAICEAIILTQDTDLRPSAERGVQYLIVSQHPDNGGWKFRPISKLMVGDLSVTGWALMALHTARLAGMNVPLQDFVRASAFLDSVSVSRGARYKLEPIGPDSTFTMAMTAEGLLCRQWFGWPKDEPELQNGVSYLMRDENRPAWVEGRRNIYAWFYAAQVLHNMGGKPCRDWNEELRALVLKNQVAQGSNKPGQDVRGSWSPLPLGDPFENADRGGRLYMTALCVMILETPFRHQPIYPSEESDAKPETISN